MIKTSLLQQQRGKFSNFCGTASCQYDILRPPKSTNPESQAKIFNPPYFSNVSWHLKTLDV